MNNLTTLSVPEFENRLIGGFNWITVNRESLGHVEASLRDAASHIEQVGWVQHKNFADPRSPATSPCCAVGALHALTYAGGRFGGVADAAWMFKILTGEDLVHYNDEVATEASQVTGYLRVVADAIASYLEATRA